MSSSETVVAALRAVFDRLPDLYEARLKGSPRPWRQAILSDEARYEMDAHARTEKAEADDRLPGFSAAPLHLDILDSSAALLMEMDMLHEHIAQTVGHDRLPPAPSAYSDARPYLAYCLVLLDEATKDDPDMLELVAEKSEIWLSTIQALLGEVYDGQRLNAICPFCVGRTQRRLAGELTMRIRIIPSTHPSAGEGMEEVVVICENPDGCNPFSNEVDVWVEGRPAWRYQRWEWLGKRMHPTRAA